MKIDLIAIDLDDTLLKDDLSISEANIDALDKAEKTGIKIVLASGRNYPAMKGYVDMLKLRKRGDFLICSNGTETFEADTGEIVERLLLDSRFSAEIALEIESRGFPWQIYKNDRIVCSRINPWALKDTHLTKLPIEVASDTAALFSAGITKFVIPGEPRKISGLMEEFVKLFDHKAEVFTSKPFFLEVLPYGAGKGPALARLAHRLGIEAANIMAIGDAMNDLEMIRFAGWGCAPANAIDSVKHSARVVSARTNDEDAVADLVFSVALS
jgi:Cof subfamily protein (haloacid dehalogenase superfamily)